MHYIRSLAGLDRTDLDVVGGKAANLGSLIQAGLPVPPGFCVTTAGYHAFVADNDFANHLHRVLADTQLDDPASLDAASQQIRASFDAGQMPSTLQVELCQAYQGMAESPPPVAVRSSATAEDLPDLSFAGQQDTYLNVVGLDALCAAVVRCWSSLWTARAIGYRARNRIPHDGLGLAVVVQEMVPSEAAGVLFTANPLTGLLREMVVDATLGLGEALVSGQVEPDHFVVDARSEEVRSRTLGRKQVVTRARPGGGVETLPQDAAARPTLSDEQLLQLLALGSRAEQQAGGPQDVEWALAGNRFYLLQSRPITSLFPVPTVSFDPLLVWFSFGAAQGVLEPMTPLGRDVFRYLIAGVGHLFGVHLRPEEVKLAADAGERLWVQIDGAIRHPVGIRLIRGALGAIEPSVAQILTPLLADPRLGAGTGRVKPSTVWRIARVGLPILLRMLGNLLHPANARAALEADIEAYLASAHILPAADRFGRLGQAVAFMRDRLGNAFPFLLPRFLPVFGPSMASLSLLQKLAGENGGLALEVTRGLPNNVTTEMDLALWRAALAIRADVAASDLFHQVEAPALAGLYLAGNLPPAAQAAIAAFMERYGMRGLGEIDLGRSRWREDPTPVMHTLRSYLDIDPAFAPDLLFGRGVEAAQEAVEALAARARRRPAGRLRARLVRAAAQRVRLLMGARESPKFFAIRTMGIVRPALMAVGQEFVEAGTLDRVDDLFFLTVLELEVLSRDEPGDWSELVAQRRLAHERELGRRQVPRVLLSDGRAFYQGLGAGEGEGAGRQGEIITGSPVSPGIVQGPVRVILDPRTARLVPGEVLVCPGTDPAWTPLFLAAGGLVTEVGGMMTHGSVVAREYGIPAIVGVHRATERLRDGQMILLDGTTGQITLLS